MFVKVQPTSLLWPMKIPGVPGSEAPRAWRSPMFEADLVPDPRHARRQVRVAGEQRTALRALRSPQTAQLLEPLASTASPSSPLSRSSCSTEASRVAVEAGARAQCDRVAARVNGVEHRGQLGAELARHLGPQQLALPVGREPEGEQLDRGQHVGRAPGVEADPQDLELAR